MLRYTYDAFSWKPEISNPYMWFKNHVNNMLVDQARSYIFCTMWAEWGGHLTFTIIGLFIVVEEGWRWVMLSSLDLIYSFKHVIRRICIDERTNFLYIEINIRFITNSTQCMYIVRVSCVKWFQTTYDFAPVFHCKVQLIDDCDLIISLSAWESFSSLIIVNQIIGP